MRCMNNL